MELSKAQTSANPETNEMTETNPNPKYKETPKFRSRSFSVVAFAWCTRHSRPNLDKLDTTPRSEAFLVDIYVPSILSREFFDHAKPIHRQILSVRRLFSSRQNSCSGAHLKQHAKTVSFFLVTPINCLIQLPCAAKLFVLLTGSGQHWRRVVR